jgi:ribonuclease T2
MHGFWPQYERGYPQFCADSSKVPAATIQHMLPIMPAEKLIQHEWDRHGTCSGLPQAEYFQTIERVFKSISVPADFKTPIKQINVTPASIRKKFVAANPKLSEQSVRVLCGGRYLSEVRVCLAKDLKPRPCSSEVRDTCRAPEIIMQPVR